jgi:hypothetical protein
MRLAGVFVGLGLGLAAVAPGWAAGPASVIVHSKFGGQIFGFDIDQNGTEGVLSEAKPLGNQELAAVETFDQATGKIIKVVKKLTGKDDFVTFGVTGTSTGLVEREDVKTLYVSKRVYEELNPLDANSFTGTWQPPLTTKDLVIGMSRTQGVPTTGFLVYHNTANGHSFLIGSNVAANTFGPPIQLTNQVFQICCGPVIAYDSVTNDAVVASATGEVGGPAPVIAVANLTTGHLHEFTGLLGPPPYHQGFVNGIAVDAADGIACTTTELDFRVEFYDIKKETAFAVVLPGATGQLQSGADVEYDPVNKLFLVAQPVSSTAQSGSSIQVYSTTGTLVESLNGFNFSNADNVIGTHIALNPSNRSGYVDGPDSGVTELQAFTY